MSRAGNNLTGRTLGGLLWAFVGTGSQAALQVAVLVVLARLLTPQDFGVVAAAMVVVGLSSIFSHLGIGPALVQRPELTPAHVRTGFTSSILLGLALQAVVWGLAPAIAEFFQVAALAEVLQALSFVFPMQGLSAVGESLLQRDLQFRRLAGLEVASVAVGYGGVGIALAATGFGVWSLVAAHLAQAGLKGALVLWAQPHPKSPLLDRTALADLVYFGGGMTAARLSNYLAIQGDNLVVGRFLGPEALGVYGRAYQLMTAPAVLFGQVLDRVLFPVMSRMQDQPERLAEAFRRGVGLIALAVLPTSVTLSVLAPELIELLLGPQWGEVVLPFQIFAGAMLFRTSYKMSDSLARATGAVYRRAWRQGLYAGLVLTGALVGQAWGLPGVAWGVAGAIGANFLLMAQLSLGLTGMSWREFALAHLPGVALALLVGAEVWALASLLRAWNTAPLPLLLTCAAAVLPCFLAAWYLPHVFLGPDGRWVVRQLTARLAR